MKDRPVLAVDRAENRLVPRSIDATALGWPALAVRYVTPMSACVRPIAVCPTPMEGNLTKLGE